jgi:hypothetical protein
MCLEERDYPLGEIHPAVDDELSQVLAVIIMPLADVDTPGTEELCELL